MLSQFLTAKFELNDNNINHGSLHTLRHTFATKLFKNGIDIKVISELLGHSDISITYNIRTHVIKEQKKKAVDVLDSNFAHQKNLWIMKNQ